MIDSFLNDWVMLMLLFIACFGLIIEPVREMREDVINIVLYVIRPFTWRMESLIGEINRKSQLNPALLNDQNAILAFEKQWNDLRVGLNDCLIEVRHFPIELKNTLGEFIKWDSKLKAQDIYANKDLRNEYEDKILNLQDSFPGYNLEAYNISLCQRVALARQGEMFWFLVGFISIVITMKFVFVSLGV